MTRASSSSADRLSLAGVILLASALGYLTGRIATVQFALATVPPVRLIPDERAAVAVVRIDGLRDDRVHGQTSSGVRLFIGDTLVIPAASGAFAVAGGPLLTNEITVVVPTGMRFVASRNGKKYYAVDSAGGERLAPANRVYFPTAAAAQAAGYVP
jgi:hypothetical protein